MRFQRIIEALYRQPLDITPAGFDAIDAIVRPHLTAGPVAAGQGLVVKDGPFILGKTDLFGTPLPEMLEVDEENGCGIITITGPLLQHAALIEKSCGAVSYQDIVAALEQANESRIVRNIILNIDSPGGQHCGAIEAAERVSEIALAGEKEIFAFTDSTMGSAAYFLASGCNAIFATRSSYVGCIGSLIGFIDFSKAYELAGKKAIVLASGKYKGTGIDGTALSLEQYDYLMGLVTSAAGQFKDHVLQFRKMDAEAMEGQTFYGEDAQASGVVDELVNDLDEVMEFLEGD